MHILGLKNHLLMNRIPYLIGCVAAAHPKISTNMCAVSVGIRRCAGRCETVEEAGVVLCPQVLIGLRRHKRTCHRAVCGQWLKNMVVIKQESVCESASTPSTSPPHSPRFCYSTSYIVGTQPFTIRLTSPASEVPRP